MERRGPSDLSQGVDSDGHVLQGACVLYKAPDGAGAGQPSELGVQGAAVSQEEVTTATPYQLEPYKTTITVSWASTTLAAWKKSTPERLLLLIVSTITDCYNM